MIPQDYCTLWPDRIFGLDYSHCCAAHDLDYAMGLEGLASDLRLAGCVIETSATLALWAGLMLMGVIFYRVILRKFRKRS